MMNDYFDQRARNWDGSPTRLAQTSDIFAALERQVALQPDWTALDYGSGSGLLTLALARRVAHVWAVDLSVGMMEVLMEKARAEGIANITTLVADFTREPLPDERFDLVTSALALHHIDDPPALLRGFRSLLQPGGMLAVADLDTEDGSFHGDNHHVRHFGFDRDELAARLTGAGFDGIKITTAAHRERGERTYTIFLATARAV
jgi:ubiquinone/menaquinone biosynthesis C-methylase UbiE